MVEIRHFCWWLGYFISDPLVIDHGLLENLPFWILDDFLSSKTSVCKGFSHLFPIFLHFHHIFPIFHGFPGHFWMTPGGPPPHTATAPRGDLLNEVAAPQREPGDAVPSSGPRAGESARGRSVDEDTRGVQQRMTTGMGWGYVMGYIYIYYIYI